MPVDATTTPVSDVPLTVATFVIWVFAAAVALTRYGAPHVTVSPGSSDPSNPAHVMVPSPASSSLSATPTRATLPVLVTTNV